MRRSFLLLIFAVVVVRNEQDPSNRMQLSTHTAREKGFWGPVLSSETAISVCVCVCTRARLCVRVFTLHATLTLFWQLFGWG